MMHHSLASSHNLSTPTSDNTEDLSQYDSSFSNHQTTTLTLIRTAQTESVVKGSMSEGFIANEAFNIFLLDVKCLVVSYV